MRRWRRRSGLSSRTADLIARVLSAISTLLAAQDDLDAQRSNLESVSRQLDQAEKRYEVGLIAVTDVRKLAPLTIAAQQQVIASKRQLASAQKRCRNHGEGFDTLARPIEPFELMTPEPSSEDRWWKWPCSRICRCIEPLAADIARENVSSARAVAPDAGIWWRAATG